MDKSMNKSTNYFAKIHPIQHVLPIIHLFVHFYSIHLELEMKLRSIFATWIVNNTNRKFCLNWKGVTFFAEICCTTPIR